MPITLNSKGRSRLNRLIASSDIDKASSWAISAIDEDKLLGDPPKWGEYGSWFLGVDTDAAADTKSHYAYPFGKNGKVYRSALIAIKSRAAANSATDIYNAADSALKRVDGAKPESKGDDIDMEQRTINYTMSVETRADGKKLLRGHAAVFNQETVIGNAFREIILPGAFVNTIVEDDQRALFNHDPNFVLGRKSVGTLELSEDAKGLSIVIDPPDTQLIRDLVLSPIERGDIDQMSFSFKIVGTHGSEWERGENGLLDLRKIKKCRVFDISPVTFPAYGGTDIALRSYDEWRKEQRSLDEARQREESMDAARLLDIKRKRATLKNKED